MKIRAANSPTKAYAIAYEEMADSWRYLARQAAWHDALEILKQTLGLA